MLRCFYTAGETNLEAEMENNKREVENPRGGASILIAIFVLKAWLWVAAAGVLLCVAQGVESRLPGLEAVMPAQVIPAEAFTNSTVAERYILANAQGAGANIFFNATDIDVKAATLLRYGNSETRISVLNMPGTWQYARISSEDAWIILALITLWAVMVSLAACMQTNEDLNLVAGDGNAGGMTFAKATGRYISQDFGYMLFEQVMHHKQTHRGPYGGMLHWFRDTIEKMLSLSLVIIFVLFLARVLKYVYWWFSGAGWKFAVLPMDVNAAITVVGFALIIDSIILVSAMTDAPGIAETLDAIILALAGYVIMLVEALPGKHSVIAFQFSNHGGTAIAFPLLTGALFIVRWFVRNPTLKAMHSGRLPNQYVEPMANNTGDGPPPRP